MNKKFNVLIIGAGNIGAFFDAPGSDRVLTHAHAFVKHKKFNLLGFVDSDIIKARKAAKLWGCKAFKNTGEAFNCEKIEIACVAVPDDCHYAVLKDLSRFPLKIVFAEKPLTKTLDEAKEMIRIFRKKNIEVMMNYSRRFVPEIEAVRRGIIKGDYGRYLTGTGYYGKGLVHNGSHLIDLLRYFMGEIKTAKPVSGVKDFYPDDKSISAVLTFKNNRQFFLQYADCRRYTIFEIDILFEKKRIRICDLGFKMEVYDARPGNMFKGYRNIVKVSEISTSFQNALYNAAENIYNHLTRGAVLKCSAEEGYKTLKTCMKIRESIPQ